MKNINSFELDYITDERYVGTKKDIQSFNFVLEGLKDIINIEKYLKLVFKKINLIYKTTALFDIKKIDKNIFLSNASTSLSDIVSLNYIPLFNTFDETTDNYLITFVLQGYKIKYEEFQGEYRIIASKDKEQGFIINKFNLLDFKHIINIYFDFVKRSKLEQSF